MSKAKERRRYIRTEKPIAVTLKIKIEKAVKEIQAQTKNISAAGILLEIPHKIALNTELELSLSPASVPNPIHIQAKIVRSEKIDGRDLFNTGVEFVKIEEDNKNTFLKFLCDTIYSLS